MKKSAILLTLLLGLAQSASAWSCPCEKGKGKEGAMACSKKEGEQCHKGKGHHKKCSCSKDAAEKKAEAPVAEAAAPAESH